MGKATEYTRVAVDKLIPYVNNAKQHSESQVTKIASSIREFGFLNPVLIDASYNIIAGHGRILAAKKLQMDEVPCLFVEGLTDAQRKAYILADNRLSELGEWDMELVMGELAELDELGFDTELTGFDFQVEPEITDDEDDVPELPTEPKAKLGDLYQLGRHRLICGDSTDVNVIDRLMDGVKADMVFCDAPYGYKYESNHQDKYEMLQNDDKILDFIPAIWGAMQDNCPVYEFCGWQSLKQWLEYFENTSLDLKNVIIWKKNNWSMGDLKGAYAGQYEVILYLNKGRVELNGARDTDIWEFDREPPKMHPTMKPIELIAYALNKSSKKGDVVLDCFGGSGSTLIACEQLNRKCYMAELDPKYVDVIVERWENFTGKKAVLISE
jgi:DNA modification methylase